MKLLPLVVASSSASGAASPRKSSSSPACCAYSRNSWCSRSSRTSCRDLATSTRAPKHFNKNSRSRGPGDRCFLTPSDFPDSKNPVSLAPRAVTSLQRVQHKASYTKGPDPLGFVPSEAETNACNVNILKVEVNPSEGLLDRANSETLIRSGGSQLGSYLL